MEEVEPVERAQEEIHEKAHESKERWVLGVALTAALLAALAAVASSLSSHHESECVLDQIKASDQWSYYQAKGIKENTAALETRLLEAIGKPSTEDDHVERYRREKEEIRAKAEALTEESERHMAMHRTYARTVTLSQIAIAVAAISVLTKRRPFWYFSLCFGAAGAFYLAKGLFF
jgi:hypothetical protein